MYGRQVRGRPFELKQAVSRDPLKSVMIRARLGCRADQLAPQATQTDGHFFEVRIISGQLFEHADIRRQFLDNLAPQRFVEGLSLLDLPAGELPETAG